MTWYRALILFTAIASGVPAIAQQPQAAGGPSDRSTSPRSAERWVQQLANDLDHLQEDLYYERGNYPAGLTEKVDRAAHSVAHFLHVLRQSKDVHHLRRDFQEMDKDVHDLVKTLNQSNDSWLRRQATRIVYADEQVHFTIQRRLELPRESRRELLARQAHLLEIEARDFEALAERVVRRDQHLRDDIREFVEHADHFHQVVHSGGEGQHLREDFEKVDDAWHHVVDRVNKNSTYVYYLRNAAQDVNTVHNQIHDLLMGDHRDHERTADNTRPPARPTPPPPPPQPPRQRPAIEFEIPGIGRFQIPR